MERSHLQPQVDLDPLHASPTRFGSAWPRRIRPGRRAVDRLLGAGRYENGSLNLAKTVPVADGCVNGMVLLMASYFGTPGPIT